jgi:hypothetical protein
MFTVFAIERERRRMEYPSVRGRSVLVGKGMDNGGNVVK